MSELIRFDVESHDGKPAICIEASKGYWTPWYIAQRRINELRSSRDEYRDNHEKLVEALMNVKAGLEAKLVGSPEFTLESMIDGVSRALAAPEAGKGSEL